MLEKILNSGKRLIATAGLVGTLCFGFNGVGAENVISFKTQPDVITTNLNKYPILDYNENADEVTVNGSNADFIDQWGGFESFPSLNEGENNFNVVVKKSGQVIDSYSKKIIYNPGFSTSGKTLLYGPKNMFGSVVIDIDDNIILGNLPPSSIVAITNKQDFVINNDGQVFDTSNHKEIGPKLPMSFTGKPIFSADDEFCYEGHNKIQFSNRSMVGIAIPELIQNTSAQMGGDKLLSWVDNKSVKTIDLESLAITSQTNIGQTRVAGGYGNIDPSGKYMFMTSYSYAVGALDVWNLVDGGLVKQYDNLYDYMGQVDFSKDGKTALIGSSGNSYYGGGGVYLFNVENQNRIGFYPQYGASIVKVDKDNRVYITSAYAENAGRVQGSKNRRGVEVLNLNSSGQLEYAKSFFLGRNSLPEGKLVVKDNFQVIPTPTPTPFPTPSPTPVPGSLEDKLKNLKWIAYSPTNYNPNYGVWPPRESLIVDMQTLYDSGFRGIVLYGANDGLKDIPLLAKQIGFQGIIAGIWDIDKSSTGGLQEYNNVIAVKDIIDGTVEGNEGLNVRYNQSALINGITDLKTATGKPVATSEALENYNANLVAIGDFVFPNVHPYWSGIRNSHEAVNWTVSQFNWLKSISGGKLVVIKETGFPTAGDPDVSEQLQYDYYKNLASAPVNFVYFEAFDQPWKSWQPVEPYWGLWDKNRNPKKVVSLLKRSGVEDWRGYE